MKQTIRQLEHWISTNQTEQALRFLQDSLTDFRADQPTYADEVKDLRMTVIGLSSRYHDLRDKQQRGTVPKADLETEKRSITNALLMTIGDLPDYQKFAEYIDDLEEEQAWQEATNANTISAYQSYFNQYPEGKYREETAAIIEQLQEIQDDQSRRMKAAAEAERQRRESMQQGSQFAQAPRPEPQAAGFAAGYDRPPQAFAGQSTRRSGSGQQSFDNTIAILCYIGSIVIPLIGIGVGLYIHLAKAPDRSPKFDTASKTKANIMLGIAGIMFIVYLS